MRDGHTKRVTDKVYPPNRTDGPKLTLLEIRADSTDSAGLRGFQGDSKRDMRPENDPFFVQLLTVKLKLKNDKDKQCHLFTETVSTSSKWSISKVNLLKSNCHSPITNPVPGKIPAESETYILNSKQELTSSMVSNKKNGQNTCQKSTGGAKEGIELPHWRSHTNHRF